MRELLEESTKFGGALPKYIAFEAFHYAEAGALLQLAGQHGFTHYKIVEQSGYFLNMVDARGNRLGLRCNIEVGFGVNFSSLEGILGVERRDPHVLIERHCE